MNKQSKHESDESRLDQELFAAMSFLGWIPATTASSMGQYSESNSHLQLPIELSDPLEVLNRSDTPPNTCKVDKSDEFVVENLAQAARDGSGMIPDEIVERMQQDRQFSEREEGFSVE